MELDSSRSTPTLSQRSLDGPPLDSYKPSVNLLSTGITTKLEADTRTISIKVPAKDLPRQVLQRRAQLVCSSTLLNLSSSRRSLVQNICLKNFQETLRTATLQSLQPIPNTLTVLGEPDRASSFFRSHQIFHELRVSVLHVVNLEGVAIKRTPFY